MPTLQVKNLPAPLHDALAERSRSLGTTMSEYVTSLLRRDLSRPTTDEWLAKVHAVRQNRLERHIDSAELMDAVKTEWE